jgi:hypothetical protein
MRSNEFMAALPEAVQRYLGQGLRVQRGRLWPWGVQFYLDDPRYHYEVSRVPPRLGDRLELGLHFESKNPADNRWLLAGFDARLVEVKASLGDGVVAEPWDRGWTKVYETVPLEPYDEGYLHRVAGRMAAIVDVLHPVYQAIIQANRKT